MRKYALLLLIIIVIIILTLFRTSDSFSDVKTMHSDFVADRLKTFGDIGMALIKSSNDGVFGESANQIAGTFSEKDQDKLFKERSNLWKQIDTCEAIKTMDCSAFDKKDFALDCGICLDIGKDSKGAATTGGLVVINRDKKNQRKTAKANTIPDYKATLGFCPLKKLVTTKKECLRLQNELLCAKNKSFDVSHCSQCSTSSEFAVIDNEEEPGIINNSGFLHIIGSGLLNISEQGFDPKNNIVLSNKPIKVPVNGKEGTRITLDLLDNGNGSAFVAGYLSGIVYKGDFKTDILTIAITDQVTGRKPRQSGATKIRNFPVKMMSPGFSKKNMSAVFVIPFSFVDTTMEQVKLCKTGPFITTNASAQMLKTSPCFQKDSGPGNYNLACLQDIWAANGCNERGTGYPNNSVAASFLMADGGNLRTSNEISNYIYKKAITSVTRYDENGRLKTIADWNNDSMFCLGRPIKSTCDFITPGPRDSDCIVYLWKDLSTPDWCKFAGTLSPVDANGTRNEINIRYWKTFGDQDAIRGAMNNMYNMAKNDEANKNQKTIFLEKCFGQAYSDRKVAQWAREEAEEKARRLAEEKARREAQEAAERRAEAAARRAAEASRRK